MHPEHIKLYYHYNQWANERILEAAEKLGAEQLRQANDLGWGSLLGGLAHTFFPTPKSAGSIFSSTWNRPGEPSLGMRPISRPCASCGGASRTSCGAAWTACRRAICGARIPASGGEREYHWALWQALFHVVNHGTQHRSECAALLTGFGHSPGDLDFSQFLYERYGRSDFARAEDETVARDDICLLFRYNDWANDRVLDVAERLTPEQLREAKDLGWGSLRGTLTHLMDAEIAWRELLSKGVFVDHLQPEAFADVAAIRQRWLAERAAFWRYLESLSDEDFLGVLSYEAEGETRHRLLWQCLAHLVNHGTQHRAECAAILTGFGHSPGNLDFTMYLSEGD